jgi:hypothetical protein
MVLLLDKLREAFCFCRQETEAVLVIIGDDHPGGYARGPCRGIRSLHDGSCLAPPNRRPRIAYKEIQGDRLCGQSLALGSDVEYRRAERRHRPVPASEDKSILKG